MQPRKCLWHFFQMSSSLIIHRIMLLVSNNTNLPAYSNPLYCMFFSSFDNLPWRRLSWNHCSASKMSPPKLHALFCLCSCLTLVHPFDWQDLNPVAHIQPSGKTYIYSRLAQLTWCQTQSGLREVGLLAGFIRKMLVEALCSLVAGNRASLPHSKTCLLILWMATGQGQTSWKLVLHPHEELPSLTALSHSSSHIVTPLSWNPLRSNLNTCFHTGEEEAGVVPNRCSSGSSGVRRWQFRVWGSRGKQSFLPNDREK